MHRTGPETVWRVPTLIAILKKISNRQRGGRPRLLKIYLSYLLAVNSLGQLNSLKSRWRPVLASDAHWYLTIVPQIQQWTDRLSRESISEQEESKKVLYDFFEERLSKQQILLGSGSGHFDTERKPIDTIVLHHTSNPPGLTSERLSAIELIRLYAPYFLSPNIGDLSLKGQPVYSGHVRDGSQMFWPYHWIVRRNGTVERLLHDCGRRCRG